jgi:DNA uptake protein ComE-like DNA-binding protein
MKQMNRYWPIALLTMALLLLAACGGSAAPASPTAAPEQPAAQAQAATAAPTAAESLTQTITAGAAQPPESVQPIENTKINLNDMTADQLLAAIPGFGNRMVREFFEYQPYVSIQQFRREIGKYVSDEQVAEYENYVYVPIAVDDSDAETLMQIPGLEADAAAALIAARPFGSNEAFLTRLAELAPAVAPAVAASYLDAN